jgi:FkbM family methyltransferase
MRGMPLPRRIWRELPCQETFTVHVGRDRSFLLCDQHQGIEREIFWCGLDHLKDRQSLRVWRRLCEWSSVILDIGANVGLYSLTAAAVNPRARIVAFEPLQATHAMLRRNIAVNGFAIETVQAAVGHISGTVRMTYDQRILQSAAIGGPPGPSQEDVPIVTLADFLPRAGLDHVDLVKVDVESFEPEVFEGLGGALDDRPPTFLVEILTDRVGARVEALLPRGHRLFHIDESRGPREVECLRRVSRESVNYLCCAPEVASKLGVL